MRFIYMAFIGCLLAATGCNSSNTTNNASENSGTPVTKEPVHSKLNDENTQALMGTVSKYYALKNALVATKATRADSAASELISSTMQLQASLQKDSANMPVVKLYIDSIISQSKMITSMMDETCEKKRIYFEVVSRNMYAMLKSVELKNAHVYHQFCPMAFNDKGAYWLSGESEILNPYFGKKMLECGEVTDSM